MSCLLSFYGQYYVLNYKPVENTIENKGSPGDKDLLLPLLVLCCHNLFLLLLGDRSVHHSSGEIYQAPTLMPTLSHSPVH